MGRTESRFALCEPEQTVNLYGSLSDLLTEWWEEPTANEYSEHEEQRMARVRSVTSRAYQGVADLPAIIELALAYKAATACADRPSIAGLRAQLTAPNHDARATRLWIDTSGALVAFATLGSGGHLVIAIHPGERTSQGRHDALMDAALDWGVAQARERVRRTGAPVTLTTDCVSEDNAYCGRLEAHGFTPRDDEAVWMTRALDETLTPAPFPAGYRLRSARDDEADMAAYVALFNEAFTTGVVNQMTVARRRALMADDAYIPELDLVAEAADGSLAAFCRALALTEERERLGRREGRVDHLGVGRAHRRLGLGQAMLSAGLHALRESGVAQARLRVWASDITARQLYAAAGFTECYRVTVYERVVTPTTPRS